MSTLRTAERIDTRVYAVLAVYLLVCSLSLTVKAFAVSWWKYTIKLEL